MESLSDGLSVDSMRGSEQYVEEIERWRREQAANESSTESETESTDAQYANN